MINNTSYPLSLLCCLYIQAQRTATSVWQLMILHNDGQVSSMSISEAQRQGYSLTTTARRMVLRSRYKQPHAKLTMVGNHACRQQPVQRSRGCGTKCFLMFPFWCFNFDHLTPFNLLLPALRIDVLSGDKTKVWLFNLFKETNPNKKAYTYSACVHEIINTQADSPQVYRKCTWGCL